MAMCTHPMTVLHCIGRGTEAGMSHLKTGRFPQGRCDVRALKAIKGKDCKEPPVVLTGRKGPQAGVSQPLGAGKGHTRAQ